MKVSCCSDRFRSKNVHATQIYWELNVAFTVFWRHSKVFFTVHKWIHEQVHGKLIDNERKESA